jgi:hypothetical protein
VHKKTRGDMLVKYFAEKVNPGMHDLAAKKEAFGAWNEEFIRGVEGKLRAEMQSGHDEEIQLHETHMQARSGMLMKYSKTDIT